MENNVSRLEKLSLKEEKDIQPAPEVFDQLQGLKKLIWIIIVLLIVLIVIALISVYSILKDSHKEEHNAANNVSVSRVPNNMHKCPGSEMICKNDEACTPVYNDQSETGPFLFLNDHFCRKCYDSYKNCAQSVTECCRNERCIKWYETNKHTCGK